MSYWTLETLLFVNYKECITHYAIDKQIEYRVLVVSERDLSVHVEEEVRVLRQFCRVVSYDFYGEFSDDLAELSGIDLAHFKKFAPRCKKLIGNLNSIAIELESRLKQNEST
jgi:hypothetical protein